MNAAEYQFVGDVVDYAHENNVIDIKCENARIEITIKTPDIIRVRMYPGDSIPETHSYAVLPFEDDPGQISIEDSGDQLKISTEMLLILVRKSPCAISFMDLQQQEICADHPGYAMGWHGTKIICHKKLHDEVFYGLGEKTLEFNKRGHLYTMWNSDIPAYTIRTDPLYQSHPFFVGMRDGKAFAIFMDNSYRSEFNMGMGTKEFYSFGADDGVLDYYFIYGPELKTLLGQYSKLVGKMPLPPKWSLGYQQCRWSYHPETEVMDLAYTFRHKEIPCDVLYLDIHYMKGYRCFTWDKQRFAEPEKMIAKLSEMGFKVVLIVDPGIKVDPDYEVFKSGAESDHFCTYPDGSLYQGKVWPGWCCFPDFSRPATREWWGDLYKKHIEEGVAGFWNDMNEPAARGGTIPDIVRFDDEGRGASHLKMHNLYGSLMARATYEGLRKLQGDRRPFVLDRAGYAGVQRYAAVWTGDNVSSWEHLRLSIDMCLGMGMSGIAFCGPDIGGFSGTPTPELFTRWIQLGTFMPLFRTHSAFNTPQQEPWIFGDVSEKICKKYIRLRYELMPYIYNAFYQSAKTGLPIMRPMVLEFQNDPETHEMSSQFMFGEKLLIAPVREENQRACLVYFPEGDWFNFWTGETSSGPQWKWVDAPLDVIPVYVKAGAVIPMQQAMNYVGERKADPLYLNLYPKEGISKDSLYEDDGESFDYQQGKFCITPFDMEQHGNTLELRIGERIGSFEPGDRSFIVQMNMRDIPEKVLVAGETMTKSSSMNEMQDEDFGWYYDSGAKKLLVNLKDERKGTHLKIVFSSREKKDCI